MSGWLVTLRFCSGGLHKQPADLWPHRFRKNISESLAQGACIRLLRVRVLLRCEIISISILNILYHKEGFYFIIISVTVICASAMSHAQTGRRMFVGRLLTKEHLTGWLYTANAVTASKKRSVCEAVGMADCVLLKTTTVRKTGISLHNPRVHAGGIRSDDRGIYR